jgi:hypothetical protein
MLRPFTLQPLSLVLGLAFGLACFVAMGQSSISSTPIGTPVRIEYMPHPRDMIVIQQGVPFTVPPGKLLVMTALGNTNADGQGAVLMVNGAVELANAFVYAQNPPSVCPIPIGLALPAGSVVEPLTVAGSTGNGRAWGYLATQ